MTLPMETSLLLEGVTPVNPPISSPEYRIHAEAVVRSTQAARFMTVLYRRLSARNLEHAEINYLKHAAYRAYDDGVQAQEGPYATELQRGSFLRGIHDGQQQRDVAAGVAIYEELPAEYFDRMTTV